MPSCIEWKNIYFWYSHCCFCVYAASCCFQTERQRYTSYISLSIRWWMPTSATLLFIKNITNQQRSKFIHRLRDSKCVKKPFKNTFFFITLSSSLVNGVCKCKCSWKNWSYYVSREFFYYFLCFLMFRPLSVLDCTVKNLIQERLHTHSHVFSLFLCRTYNARRALSSKLINKNAVHFGTISDRFV